MLIEDYFGKIENDIVLCPFVHSYELFKDKRSLYIGLVKGTIKFTDNSVLYFMEFVDVGDTIEKYKYSYNYEDIESTLIFRYDVAPHFRDVESFPHHKHEIGNRIVASKEPSLKEVLHEIEIVLLR